MLAAVWQFFLFFCLFFLLILFAFFCQTLPINELDCSKIEDTQVKISSVFFLIIVSFLFRANFFLFFVPCTMKENWWRKFR